MLFIIYTVLFNTSTLGVRRRTDESDSIAEIMWLKGGEAAGIFRLRQLMMKNCCIALMLSWECLFAV
jgi:hypothetical protein